MTVDIEKLEALAKNATPGPWWIDSHGMTMMSMAKLEVVFNHPAQGVAVRNEDTGNLSHWRNDWDASFIAAANPEVVLELTQTIRDLQSSIQGLKTGYEAYERVNAELKAECEKLRSKLENPDPILIQCMDSAIAEQEQLESDAKRYRWLREPEAGNIEVVEWIGPHTASLVGDDLDSVIDAAMSKEQSHD
ncbi:hypothetical protein AB7M18_003541 [Pseudomonas viridiflava]